MGREGLLREFYAVRGAGRSRNPSPPRMRRFAFRALFVMVTRARGGRELCADLFIGAKLRLRGGPVIGREGDLWVILVA